MKNKRGTTVPWTRFMDMHSGGGNKEKWEQIFIEAPEAEARVIFYNMFGHSPDCVTCTCCGNDYSVSEHESLAIATAYERGCDYDNGYIERPRTKYPQPYLTLDEYRMNNKVRIIPASEIKPEHRIGEVPVQGYVWAD